MSKGAEGERFLAAFGELTCAVGDDPAELEKAWKESTRLQGLCDELAQLVRGFEIVEEWSPLAFTNHVSAASTRARRAYDEHWCAVVSNVANRKFLAILDELFGSDFDDAADEVDATPSDPLASQIAEWKESADEEARQIQQMIDYVSTKSDTDDFGDFDWVDECLVAWDRLKVGGLDIDGALWRRRGVPHVLVPVHVSKHYGASRTSLHRRLHQAGKAFIFGAPLAALALQRAVIEEVLTKHWGAEKGWIQNANLPHLSWDARADRLKNLANDALHGDPEKLSNDQLERAIIENFLLLRSLIENAPENPDRHDSARP